MTTISRWFPRALPLAVRRMGWGVFAFFLIKGLLWLLIPAALAVWSAT